MPLRLSDGPVGAPWERPLRGRLDRLVVDSELLADNPLRDPARRPLYVYVPPGIDDADRVPSVYMLQGYGAQLDEWLARTAFEPTVIERLDEMFATGKSQPAVVVFVDAWTALGGSQFLNSAGTGRYMDYLCDEVVPFVDQGYPTIANRDHRGVAGKSSGGYGAMVNAMLRPDVFGGLLSRAGDALFECCYLPEFPRIARTLRDQFDGSFEVLRRRIAQADHFEWSVFGAPLALYACAAAYSPDPDRPGEVLLPFELATGRLNEQVWRQWLELDPVRMAPRHGDALRSMRAIHLDAGRGDEFFLDLSAEAFARELVALGLDYRLELFDGTHSGNSYRYPVAIRELAGALGP